MRRTLIAAALTSAALVGWAPATSSAHHTCAEGFELVCYAGCPDPPKICPWP